MYPSALPPRWKAPQGAGTSAPETGRKHMTQWISAAEAAARLGIKPASLYSYLSRGVLAPRRGGGGRLRTGHRVRADRDLAGPAAFPRARRDRAGDQPELRGRGGHAVDGLV